MEKRSEHDRFSDQATRLTAHECDHWPNDCIHEPDDPYKDDRANQRCWFAEPHCGSEKRLLAFFHPIIVIIPRRAVEVQQIHAAIPQPWVAAGGNLHRHGFFVSPSEEAKVFISPYAARRRGGRLRAVPTNTFCQLAKSQFEGASAHASAAHPLSCRLIRSTAPFSRRSAPQTRPPRTRSASSYVTERRTEWRPTRRRRRDR